MSATSIALSNLRAVVIVIVLAFHSVLAYLATGPVSAYRFDSPPYRWQAIPIVDSERWFGFDLFCAWQDISLMSMMFFLSGLFVPASLARKGAWAYVSERSLRIGVPCLLAVFLLMPIAYYPAYRVTAVDPGFAAYWRHWLALPFWPCGPQWFLWQLLALNVLAAGLHRLGGGWRDRVARIGRSARAHPVASFGVLVAASGLAYVPLALAYSPWNWTAVGPFALQLSRPLHYLVYFFAGYVAGACGLDRGLVGRDGPLAPNWGGWLAAAVAGFVLWAAPTSLMQDPQADVSLVLQIAAGLGFVFACAAGCFFLVAACLRFASERTRLLDSLAANAYGMYLIHYVFIVWLQFAVLDIALSAVGKAAIVFGGTLMMSWLISAASVGASVRTRLAGAKR